MRLEIDLKRSTLDDCKPQKPDNENVRFDDGGEGPSPLPVDEPVDEVARHLGGCAVQLEKSKKQIMVAVSL